MSNYSQITSFTPKDSLPSGNPSKVIKGADFDGEFNAISVAVSSKADTSTVSTLTTTVSNLSTTVDGKVAGPASATDNTLARFDGTTGKLIQGSTVVVDDSGNIVDAHLTGTPTAPTATTGTNTTQVATTAFVAAALTTGSGTTFKNKIINGNFGVNQRIYVSGAATTAGQYTLDRWKVTGTGGATFSTTANKTTVTIPSGQTLQQVVEGLNLETGTYVLSWGGTAQGRIAGGSYGASGAVTASVTGGTNTTIEFNTGTVELVMFEKAAAATTFEHRPYGVEIDMCRRYYRELCTPGIASQYVVGTGMMISTTSGNMPIVLNPPMRSTPTLSVSAAADFNMYAGTGISAASAITISAQSSKDQIMIGPTAGSALTNGAALIVYTANTSARLGLVSEL